MPRLFNEGYFSWVAVLEACAILVRSLLNSTPIFFDSKQHDSAFTVKVESNSLFTPYKFSLISKYTCVLCHVKINYAKNI